MFRLIYTSYNIYLQITKFELGTVNELFKPLVDLYKG